MKYENSAKTSMCYEYFSIYCWIEVNNKKRVTEPSIADRDPKYVRVCMTFSFRMVFLMGSNMGYNLDEKDIAGYRFWD